jgi:hypothetical protein
MIWCGKEEGFYLIWKLQDVLQGHGQYDNGGGEG